MHPRRDRRVLIPHVSGERGASRGETPATRMLLNAGVRHELHGYDHDPRSTSFGAEAAEALGLDPAKVFKTLIVALDRGLAVAIVPVTGALDLKAAARAFGSKRAAMADPMEAERRSGYVLGGISPLAHRIPSPTAIDDSALDLDRMFVSAGRRGLEIGIAPSELIRIAEASVARLRIL